MLGRKLNGYMLHKKKTLITKIKQKHFTDMFMLLNTATKSIKYSFLKSYGKFKMCFTCATYTLYPRKN